MSGWWSSLDERTRREIDTEVLHHRPIMALKAAWDALRPLGASLREADEVVHARHDALGDRVRRRQPAGSPPTGSGSAGFPLVTDGPIAQAPGRPQHVEGEPGPGDAERLGLLLVLGTQEIQPAP
ncbi:hypothetical protein ACWDZ8_40560 [Streptomyces sp. NPDC003233]